jgi:hypothetical protein
VLERINVTRKHSRSVGEKRSVGVRSGDLGYPSAVDREGRTIWIADGTAQGGLVITPPRRSKTLGGSRGPKLSTSYSDDGEVECSVVAVALPPAVL